MWDISSVVEKNPKDSKTSKKGVLSRYLNIRFLKLNIIKRW
jgi:hypothetical protein